MGVGPSACYNSPVLRDTAQPNHWDGSRSTPVHRIPLFDEEQQEISPTYGYPMPFSARNTCGPCHDYSTVAGGLHFSSSKEGSSAGRRGEPWVWVDEKTGTQLPLSYRGWPGTWNPEEVGITQWRFTQLFGRHMAGGDIGEPADTLSSAPKPSDIIFAASQIVARMPCRAASSWA